MTDQVKEQISSLTDDALPAQEHSLLLARLGQDAALRETWHRYHLISDAVRNHLPDQVVPGFSERVMAAILDEPEHSTVANGALAARWLRPVAGLAVAASVAVVAVISLQHEPASQGPAAVKVAEIPAPDADQYRRVSGMHWVGQQPQVSDQLNQYLVNHNEFAARNGMMGIAPHVRIVGYDQDAQ